MEPEVATNILKMIAKAFINVHNDHLITEYYG